jgi:hypothetical protein
MCVCPTYSIVDTFGGGPRALLGAIGALIGAAIAWLIFDGREMWVWGAFKLRVSPPLWVLGFAWALVTSLLGGLFPALRAGRPPPFEALRTEYSEIGAAAAHGSAQSRLNGWTGAALPGASASKEFGSALRHRRQQSTPNESYGSERNRRISRIRRSPWFVANRN